MRDGYRADWEQEQSPEQLACGDSDADADADADEQMLTHVIEVLGADRIVVSADYPHPDSKYPHAVERFLALDGVSDESTRRILWDNALSLHGVDGAVS
jgi:predicted TIM-barrel fold metal-dependent hydrolase